MEDHEFEGLVHLFSAELQLGTNPSCQRCDAATKTPLLPFHVGDSYRQAVPRLMFVGKSHREEEGPPGTILPSGLIDPREVVEAIKDWSWPYWSYTRAIAAAVFGNYDRGWSNIALTNLVKCTNLTEGLGSTTDLTSRTMAVICVKELSVISAEIRFLKPTHVIFYTFNLFRELLQDLPVTREARWRDDTPIHNSVPCGRKTLGWWSRRVDTPWHSSPMRVLVTGHPQFMRKDEYVRRVVQWVTEQSAV